MRYVFSLVLICILLTGCRQGEVYSRNTEGKVVLKQEQSEPEPETIHLNAYQFDGDTMHSITEQSTFYSDNYFHFGMIRVGHTILNFNVSLLGKCVGKNLKVHIKYDTGEIEETGLAYIVGMETYRLLINKPEKAKKFKILSLSVEESEGSLSEVFDLDSKDIKLTGANTLRYRRQDGVNNSVLLYNQYGVIINSFELNSSGTVIVNFGGSYYRLLTRNRGE